MTDLSKSRVLVISVDAFPKIGGVSNFAHHISNAIAERCEYAALMSPRMSTKTESEDNYYNLFPETEAKFKNYEKNKEFEDNRIRNKIFSFCKENNINKILLAHHYYYGDGALSAAAELGIECELIVHGTELSSQFIESTNVRGRFRPRPVGSRAFQLYRALVRSQKVHCNSHFTKNIAMNIHNITNYSVCGCGLDTRKYMSSGKWKIEGAGRKRQVRNANGWTEDVMHLCYVGRIVKHKRVERIYSILEKMDCVLHIVGGGPYEKEVRNAAKTKGIEKRVIFHGAVDESRKNSIVEMSDYLFLPSQMDLKTGGYEGFGITALEAIALGTIPIVSGHEGLDDLTSLYRIGLRGLISEKDADRTITLMSDYKDEYKYKSHIDEARSIIEKHLTWRHVLERMWC